MPPVEQPSELTFGQQVRTWRLSREVSQRELERHIGKARGYVTHIEGGSMLPVERRTCDLLGERLGVAGAEVWAALMDERLRRARPEVRARATFNGTALGEISADEIALIRALRDIDAGHPEEPPTAAAILRLANLVGGSALHLGVAPLEDPRAIIQALHSLNECSAWTVAEVLGVVVRVVAALERERASMGYARDDGTVPMKRRAKPRRREPG